MREWVDAFPTPLPTFSFSLIPFSFPFRLPVSAIYSTHLHFRCYTTHRYLQTSRTLASAVCRLPFAQERDELGHFVIVFRDIVVYDNRCPLSGSSWYVGNRSGIIGSYRGENHEDLYPSVTNGSQWRPPPGGEVRAGLGIVGLCESHKSVSSERPGDAINCSTATYGLRYNVLCDCEFLYIVSYVSRMTIS